MSGKAVLRPLARCEQSLDSARSRQGRRDAGRMTPDGREFLTDHFPLWHGPRARLGKGVHADDLADPSKAQTRAKARDAAGLGEPQAPETGCSEPTPASSKRRDGGRALETCRGG